MIKAFIFDLDGVIVDTAIYHYASWKDLAQDEGFSIPESIHNDLKGLGRMESLDLVLNHTDRTYSEEEKVALAAKKNSVYLEKIAHIGHGDTLPGVSAFLQAATDAGIALAVGSGSKNARPIVERLGIKSVFQAICDGTDITNSKPHPEVFNCAIAKLGMAPSECIVFEDAESGVAAAKAAGAHCIGIGDSQLLGQADVVYSTFAAFNFQEIITQFQ